MLEEADGGRDDREDNLDDACEVGSEEDGDVEEESINDDKQATSLERSVSSNSMSRSITLLSLSADGTDADHKAIKNTTWIDLFRKDVILPIYSSKQHWDKLVTILIIYSALALPTQSAFDAADTDTAEYISFIMLGVFWIDIYLNFKTAFLHKKTYICDRKEIAKYYLRTWFWIDFFSAMPFAETLHFIIHDEEIAQLFLWLHVLRVGRLARSVSMDSIRKMSQAEAFGLLTAILLIFSHWLACIFHEIAHWEQEHDRWTYHMGIKEEDSDFKRYIYSLYYAMTTVTTVGFGDIHGTNAIERFYAIVTAFIGANLYALILALISLVIHQLFDKGAAIREYDDKCVDSTNSLKLGNEFETKITTHNQDKRENFELYSMQFLLNEHIPNSMKYHIVNKVLKPILLGNSTQLKSKLGHAVDTPIPFIYCNDALLLFIAQNLQIEFCAANETLYYYNDIGTNNLYIIISGIVRLYNENESEVARLKKGNYFGDIEFFYEKRKYSQHNKFTLQSPKQQLNQTKQDNNKHGKSGSEDMDQDMDQHMDESIVHYKSIIPFTDTLLYSLSFEKFGEIEKYDSLVFKLFHKIAHKRSKQFAAYKDLKLVAMTCMSMQRKEPMMTQQQYRHNDNEMQDDEKDESKNINNNNITKVHPQNGNNNNSSKKYQSIDEL